MALPGKGNRINFTGGLGKDGGGNWRDQVGE